MANRPNIIFYFTDQQRADTCGCYGQKLDITPRLDQLASEGVKFEWAFSPQPVCGPCRALFQTGKYPTETGCFRNNVMLPANVKTLGSYIEEAGYETAYIGKWHLASDGELEKKPTIDHTITATTGMCLTKTTTASTSRATARTVSRIWRWNSLTSMTGRSRSL